MQRYSVAVESGSCSPDYRRWEERANCGHAHKTIEAAVRCKASLTRSYCNHGRPVGTACSRCNGYAQTHTTSAKWYGARLHHTDGTRLGESEAQEQYDVQSRLR